MRQPLILAPCCAALVFVACAPSTSPTAPSAAGAANLLLDTRVADDATINRASALVPFNGTLEGHYGTSAGQPPLIDEEITATGRATLLGQYTLTIEETVDLSQASATGTFTFTAANGDTVFGTFTGHAQLGAEIRITESAIVGGGTGRFASAEGTFTIRRTLDPTATPRSTVGSFEGTISAPRAARP